MFGARKDKGKKETAAKPALKAIKSASLQNGHPPTSSGLSKVRFEFFAPEASKVAVAGTFNDWDQYCTFLEKGERGMWSCTLELAAGTYQYRYIVDGMWMNEQRPSQTVSNPFGSVNNVLIVAG